MMVFMEKKQMDEYRATLEAEKDSLEEELASHGRDVPVNGAHEDWEGSTGGLEGEEPDPSDAADKIEEFITNVPLVEELEKRYKDVMRALKKMGDSAYGPCEVCGEPIPRDRLEANPAARACIKHST